MFRMIFSKIFPNKSLNKYVSTFYEGTPNPDWGWEEHFTQWSTKSCQPMMNEVIPAVCPKCGSILDKNGVDLIEIEEEVIPQVWLFVCPNDHGYYSSVM